MTTDIYLCEMMILLNSFEIPKYGSCRITWGTIRRFCAGSNDNKVNVKPVLTTMKDINN